MTEKFSRFDVADYLVDEAHIQAYLEAATEDGDPSIIAAALGDVARAQNMSNLARKVGLSREGLYKALKPGSNPGFATISKIALALGYEITFRPAQAKQQPARPAPASRSPAVKAAGAPKPPNPVAAKAPRRARARVLQTA